MMLMCGSADVEPLCRCREFNHEQQQEAKRWCRDYERRDSPWDDDDWDDISPGPTFCIYTQEDERNPVFIAIERDERGQSNCRIFHRGQEKEVWSCDFPSRVGMIQGLGSGESGYDCELQNRMNRLWREGDVDKDDNDDNADDAGLITERPRVIDSALHAAAAMHRLFVQGLADINSRITVDPASGSVSYQLDDCCIILNVCSEHPIQFVQVSGLPPSFIELQHAQFLANQMNHFQKGRVYVWAPPKGSSGTRLVFGLSKSNNYYHDDYGDVGEHAVLVMYLQMQETDPAFQAVELHQAECVRSSFVCTASCTVLL